MTIFLGLAPVFALIVLGFLFHRWKVVPDGFWPPAEHLTFYVFFPALLLTNTAEADLSGHGLGGMVAATAAGVLVVLAAAIAAGRSLRLDGPTLSSLIQGAIRPNSYVAIGTAAAITGEAGLAAVSLCIAVVVPLVNLISVVALVHCAAPAGVRFGGMRLVGPVLRNPLIIACLAGLAMNLAELPLPPVAGPVLKLLSQAALPLGLLTVGAGLDFTAARRDGQAVIMATVLKLAMLPAVTAALCPLLAVDGLPRLIAVVFAAMPVSPSAYVMARTMGGNAPVVAGTITLSTVAAAGVLPLILAALL
jgi:hypothetical protein